MHTITFYPFFYNICKYRCRYLKIKLFGEYFVNNEETIVSKEIENNKEIIIYGNGPYGEEYFVKLFCKNKIKGVYDKNYKFMDQYVEDPENIGNCFFDYVIITVMNEKLRESICSFLINKGISKDKIIYLNYLQLHDE